MDISITGKKPSSVQLGMESKPIAISVAVYLGDDCFRPSDILARNDSDQEISSYGRHLILHSIPNNYLGRW